MESKGGQRYRRMMGVLDANDVVVNINRVCEGRFELHVNFEIVKQYKTRASCNRQIEKMYKNILLKKLKISYGED